MNLVGKDSDYPDGKVHDLYLGFEDEFDRDLGFETSKKGLYLFKQVKHKIETESDVPKWVAKVRDKVMVLEEYPESVLTKESDDLEPF